MRWRSRGWTDLMGSSWISTSPTPQEPRRSIACARCGRNHGFARLRVGQCLRDELADGVGLGALRPAARGAALAGLEAAVALHRVIRRLRLALLSGPRAATVTERPRRFVAVLSATVQCGAHACSLPVLRDGTAPRP